MNAAPQSLKRGTLLCRYPEIDGFWFVGHLTGEECSRLAQQQDVIGFTANLEAFEHVKMFLGAGPEGWRQASTPKEHAHPDLVEATRIYVREVWHTRGRRAVISP